MLTVFSGGPWKGSEGLLQENAVRRVFKSESIHWKNHQNLSPDTYPKKKMHECCFLLLQVRIEACQRRRKLTTWELYQTHEPKGATNEEISSESDPLFHNNGVHP
jgi:hypothetical protein